MDSDRDGRWPIPVGVKYETFVKIPKALHQQGADSKPIAPDKLAGLMSINRHTVRGNLVFLASVGMAKRKKPRLYRLTARGIKYAKAHVAGDAKAIKRSSLDMIKKSHLRSLLDMLDTGSPEQGEIYAWIKAKGRYPDGRGTGGMHPPTGTGARTLLRIFADAGLVPVEMAGESRSVQRKPKAAEGKRKRRGAAPKTGKTPRPARDPAPVRTAATHHTAAAAAPTGETPRPARDPAALGRISITGVGNIDVNDSDTLDIAEYYMRLLRKKIKNAHG